MEKKAEVNTRRLPHPDEVNIYQAVNLNVKFHRHLERKRMEHSVALLTQENVPHKKTELDLAVMLHQETVEMLEYHANKN